MPSQAANSRPLRNAAPLPIAATMAVAMTGPMPGILRMRVQPASAAEIRSNSSLSSSTCCSTVFHSPHSVSIRLRISGVRSASAFSRISAIAAFSLAGFFSNTMPRSSRKGPDLIDH